MSKTNEFRNEFRTTEKIVERFNKLGFNDGLDTFRNVFTTEGTCCNTLTLEAEYKPVVNDNGMDESGLFTPQLFKTKFRNAYCRLERFKNIKGETIERYVIHKGKPNSGNNDFVMTIPVDIITDVLVHKDDDKNVINFVFFVRDVVYYLDIKKEVK